MHSMNSIKLKSNAEGLELEIQTDQPQTPTEMAQAMMEVLKATPPPIARVIEVKDSLPMLEATKSQAEVESHKPAKVKKRKASSPESEQEPRAEDRIRELIAAGKLDTPREGRAVWEELERLTYHYNTKTVLNALAALVGKKELDRTGPKGEYLYVRFGRSKVRSEQTEKSGEIVTVQANASA